MQEVGKAWNWNGGHTMYTGSLTAMHAGLAPTGFIFQPHSHPSLFPFQNLYSYIEGALLPSPL